MRDDDDDDGDDDDDVDDDDDDDETPVLNSVERQSNLAVLMRRAGD